jgi:NAD(P)-dependent dehydrogenase (short-subunit alcohol dehydrogenase family)
MTSRMAVVTGGAAGLGMIITRSLSRRGFHVVIADRDREAGEVAVGQIEEAGGRASHVTIDMSEEQQVRQLAERLGRLGRLSVLVNNAGGILPGPQYPDIQNWHRSLDLNLRMPMLAIQLMLPLLGDGGAVVNISSAAGLDSRPYGSPEYGVAKAGLIRFTTAVADFAERYGVRVSCVVPHWIGLPRAIAAYEQMDSDERARSGGLVDPEVVADTVVELASDPHSAGRVLVIHAGRPPYPIDPAT